MNDIAKMHQCLDDTEYDAWFDGQIARITSQPKPILKNPSATIDKSGYRHVFSVTNSLGMIQFFDSSKDAFELARTSQNQPCHLGQHPILPCGYGHNLTIQEIADKIIAVWQNEGER